MLQTLPYYVAHLQRYGDGDTLKRAAMQEVLELLAEAGLTRRAFLREAKRLGLPTPTLASLSNWTACTYTPKVANVGQLLEALQAVLAERGIEPSPAAHEALYDASALRDLRLHQFEQEIHDIDTAEQALDATILWLDFCEFPPVEGPASAGMVATMRIQGIAQLEIIRRVHSDAAEAADPPERDVHELLAAKAGIVAAHFLRIVGNYTQALDAADDGSSILDNLLALHPHLAHRQTVLSHDQSMYVNTTLAKFVLFGHLRCGNALADMARIETNQLEQMKLIDYAGKAYLRALARVDHVAEGHTLKPGILRELVALAIHPASHSRNLVEAERLARQVVAAFANMDQPDYPLLYYVSLTTLAEVLTYSGQYEQAAQVLTEAVQTAAFAQQKRWVQPGPLHRALLLLASARLNLARAQSAGRNSAARRDYARHWQDAMQQGIFLCQTAKLTAVETQFVELAHTADTEYRRLLPNHAW